MNVSEIRATIGLVSAAMDGHEAIGKSEMSENRRWLAELLSAVAGVDSRGVHDPDQAREGRRVVAQWLADIGDQM
jgi:hypothetical protein